MWLLILSTKNCMNNVEDLESSFAAISNHHEAIYNSTEASF